MSREKRTIAGFLLLAVSAVGIANAAGPKFHAAPGVPPVIGRYVVTLADSVAEDLIGVSPQILAQTYSGQIEPYTSSDARQFAVTMQPPRARSLSADPRVREVVEMAQPGDLESMMSGAAPSRSSRHQLVPVTQDSYSTGSYLYDGAGDIKSIGSDSFVYDSVGRLTQATVQSNQQSYTYDAFGNRLSATRASGAAGCIGGCEAPVTAMPLSNHIAEATYDDAGNVVGVSGVTYTHDGRGMITRATVGSDDRMFLYTADDERLAVRQGSSWTWMVRDQRGKVLRELTSLETSSSPLTLTSHIWSKDYVWRGDLLLASLFPTPGSPGNTTIYHYHLDHLGTPRLITTDTGTLVGKHTYYPFGAEMDLTPHESAIELMKFTGHERDIVAGENRSIDYMHARYYNANLARFLAVDNARPNTSDPQSWNRYAYAGNNPMKRFDPDGNSWIEFDRVTQTITMFSRDGQVIVSASASNHPSVGHPTIEPLRSGRYDFLDKDSPHFHGKEKDKHGVLVDTQAGSFGVNGIFRLEPFDDAYGHHEGVGLHAGRDGTDAAGLAIEDKANRTDFNFGTNGCVRTCETTMQIIRDNAALDPLEYLQVKDARDHAFDELVRQVLDVLTAQ